MKTENALVLQMLNMRTRLLQRLQLLSMVVMVHGVNIQPVVRHVEMEFKLEKDLVTIPYLKTEELVVKFLEKPLKPKSVN